MLRQGSVRLDLQPDELKGAAQRKRTRVNKGQLARIDEATELVDPGANPTRIRVKEPSEGEPAPTSEHSGIATDHFDFLLAP